jgi:hypothetical protein
LRKIRIWRCPFFLFSGCFDNSLRAARRDLLGYRKKKLAIRVSRFA